MTTDQTVETGLPRPPAVPVAGMHPQHGGRQLVSHYWRSLISQLWLVEARWRGLELARQIVFNGRPYLYRHAHSRIVLGERVCLNSSLRSNPLGCSRPVTLRTMRPGAEILLGPGVGLSSTVICAAARVEIGEGTYVGAEAMIFDNDFHSPAGDWNWGDAVADNPKPVFIGRGVFIGTRAIIMKGVTIGDRAIVGAGAVVTKNVPARHLAVGNPVRITPLPVVPAPAI